MGKVWLWRALGVVADFDKRLAGSDFTALSNRAQDQFNRVEKYKLAIVRAAFAEEHRNPK